MVFVQKKSRFEGWISLLKKNRPISQAILTINYYTKFYFY